MKKSIYTLLIAAFTIGLYSCNSTPSGWSNEQRKTIHRALGQYRDMVYLDEMTSAEFYIFSDNVTEIFEQNYPNYEEVVALPDIDNQIEAVITTVIVEQLDADGTNLRHIYPYRELRKECVLPRGLSRKEQNKFYKMLARKINDEYKSFETFFAAVVAGTTNKGVIASFQAECAKALFDWVPSGCDSGAGTKSGTKAGSAGTSGSAAKSTKSTSCDRGKDCK
ncbi:MAG: hypothetical protein R3Y16_07040 [Rikenellaceae bacterium]